MNVAMSATLGAGGSAIFSTRYPGVFNSDTDQRGAASVPTFSYIGNGANAIARAERGLRLSSLDPDAFWYQTTLTLAHYAAGN